MTKNLNYLILKISLVLLLTFVIKESFGNQTPAPNELKQACTIELHEKTIFISKNLETTPIKDIVINSDCASSTQMLFVHFLSNLSGKLNQEMVQQSFNANHQGQFVTISPEIIEVGNLGSLLRQKLDLSLSDQFFDLTIMGSDKVLALNHTQNISASCTNCDHPGEKSIKLTIFNSETSKDIWLTGVLSRKVSLFKATHDIHLSHSELGGKFSLTPSFVQNPELYFTDSHMLKFFKLNKSVKANHLLKYSDLTPKKLVNYGEDIKAVINSDNMKIIMRAQARNSGKLNDVIQIYNPRSKQIITGKITDFKTVEVSL